MKTYDELRASLDSIAADAIAIITEFMAAHPGKTANFVENANYIPTAFDCYTCDGEICSCDRIYVDNGRVKVVWSNSYNCGEALLEWLGVDALVDIVECLDEDLLEECEEEDEA